MTEYVSLESKKEVKKTVFTHYLNIISGWLETQSPSQDYERIVYLGECKADGDMFAAYGHTGSIHIYKGIKGDEFKD